MHIQMVRGDLTRQNDVEAIVNAANSTLLGGGGVDGAIHRAAGRELLEECKTLGGCRTGEAKITKAYNLPCDYVIHTVGPIYRGGSEEPKLLKAAYENSLKLALDHQIRKIAFPAISTGVYNYPLNEAAHIAISTVIEFQKQHPDSFDFVRFVLFDQRALDAYFKAMEEIQTADS